MVNFLLLTLLAVTAFGVPVKGSFATLTAATLLGSTMWCELRKSE